MPRESEMCSEFASHPEIVTKIQTRVEEVAGLSELFKALADETRLKVLYCLCLEELCGCDLAAILGLSTPAVSHHLRILKAARLVISRREGKLVYYSAADSHVEHIIQEGLIHYQEDAR